MKTIWIYSVIFGIMPSICILALIASLIIMFGLFYVICMFCTWSMDSLASFLSLMKKLIIIIDRFHDDFHTWTFSILPFSIL